MMDMKMVKALAEILNENGLTSLEIHEGQSKIKLYKDPVQSAVSPKSENVPSKPACPSLENTNGAVDFNQIIEVQSPIVGVFYSSPSPDSDPYVSIGSKVKKGDVLCIIEAMKMMNEITAEQDGEIVDICIKNGDIAEFGQVLFKIF